MDQQNDKCIKTVFTGICCFHRMSTIYCDINQYDASAEYFVILHADRYCTLPRTHNTKNTFTLTFIRKNECRSTIQQCLLLKKHLSLDIIIM